MSLLKTYLKKVEYPYCSLGLLQQIIMISGADHRDLSVVWQAHTYIHALFKHGKTFSKNTIAIVQ